MSNRRVPKHHVFEQVREGVWRCCYCGGVVESKHRPHKEHVIKNNSPASAGGERD